MFSSSHPRARGRWRRRRTLLRTRRFRALRTRPAPAESTPRLCRAPPELLLVSKEYTYDVLMFGVFGSICKRIELTMLWAGRCARLSCKTPDGLYNAARKAHRAAFRGSGVVGKWCELVACPPAAASYVSSIFGSSKRGCLGLLDSRI